MTGADTGMIVRSTGVVVTLALVSIGSACGSDDATNGSEPSSDLPGDIIGSGNVGGVVVDPRPHPIDDIAIAESYPEQLFISFTAGDPDCVAADASARAVDDTVRVSLTVGSSEDAPTRSCFAGSDFENSVAIALSEGLDGRSVVPVEP